MDNSMLQALADYIKVKPFKLQRQNGVTKYADYEFEEPTDKKIELTEKEREIVIKAREFYDAYKSHIIIIFLNIWLCTNVAVHVSLSYNTASKSVLYHFFFFGHS